MKSRPILFSGPMVLALLERRKMQTRRIVKPRWKDPGRRDCGDLSTKWASVWKNGTWHTWDADGVGGWNDLADSFEQAQEHAILAAFKQGFLQCPYGTPGDLLWIRETWRNVLDTYGCGYEPGYQATCHGKHLYSWRPSIHMPRWASRLTLLVKTVRIERLNDISEDDALAEGRSLIPNDPRGYFPETWEAINGTGSWAENPLVWVVEFSVHLANVDKVILPKPLQSNRETA